MKACLLEKAEDELEALQREGARVTARITEALEDVVTRTRRGVKHGYQAAEDLADDAAIRVRRHPFASIAVSFGAGALAALLVSRTILGRRA